MRSTLTVVLFLGYDHTNTSLCITYLFFFFFLLIVIRYECIILKNSIFRLQRQSKDQRAYFAWFSCFWESAQRLPCIARVTFTQCNGFNEALLGPLAAPRPLPVIDDPNEALPLPIDGGGGVGAPRTFTPGRGGGPGAPP